MRKVLSYILFLFFCCTAPLSAQKTVLSKADSLYFFNQPQTTKKQPWAAVGKVCAINTGVWAFNRFIMHEDFAYISGKTIIHNLTHGWVWDNDQFSTNLFSHPYHGNLYFNAARNSGLNFWQSVPYALGGSMLWEIVEEKEPPAINDLIATTIGGIALGEVTHRISSLLLDDSSRGFIRFLREFGATLISPMRGVKRLIHGKMWKVKQSYYKYHDFKTIPVNLSIGTGVRYLAANNYFFKGVCNPYLELKVKYGDAFSNSKKVPFDFFLLNATFGLAPGQPIISRVNLLGKLWDVSWGKEKDMEFTFGLYQHFNYFDSEEVIKNSGKIPFKISEAASFGPGLMYRLPTMSNMLDLQQSAYISAILLGGGLTDYYNIIDRNYNMGSGYSIKSRTTLDMGHRAQFALNMDVYQIFTWKGYEHKDLEHTNPLYLNSQGDKGHAIFAVLNPAIVFNITPQLKINLESIYYWRRTHYTYHKDVEHNTFESKLGLFYQF